MHLKPGSIHLSTTVAALFFGCLQWADALLIDGYSAAANDRFANSSEFIAADYNLSGVAIAPNNTWLTLVAANAYLAADHYKPAVGSTITFYATNDPNGPTITRIVTATRERFGNSDLLIGTLDRPVPEGYAVYAYATEILTERVFLGIRSWNGWSNYPYRNQTLFHVGKSKGSYANLIKVAVGQNKLSSVGDYTLANSNDEVISFGVGITADENAPSHPDYVPYETFAETGDSGAPLFFRQNSNSLKVVGIAWFKSTKSNPRFTGFTPVGNYATNITSFINQHGAGYIPAAPVGLVAQALDVNTITLTWSDVSAIETAYEIERSPAGEGQWLLVASLAANSTAYTDAGLSADTAFDYRVRALGTHGPSDYSATVTVATPPVASYADWQIDSGLSALEPDLSGPTADPDNDGIPNLLEYALAGDPLIPRSAAMPQIETTDDAVQLTFLRLRADILYRVLASDNLIDWTIIAENPGEVGSWVTVQDPIPLSENNRRFLRLQVTKP